MGQHSCYLRQPGLLLRMVSTIRDRMAPWLPIPYKLPWGSLMLLFNSESCDAILGGYYNEQDELNLLCYLLKPRMVFFDLGASHGIYSIVASRAVGREGRVYAFEPVPSEFRRLKANCAFNLAWNIRAERLAVSNTEGTTLMYAVAPNKGSYSSMRRPASDVRVPMKKIQVRTTTLDAYIDQNDISQIDVLKVDVEGAEMDVIRGGMSIWKAKQRPIVFCEVNDRRTEPWGYRGRDLLQFFAELEYLFFKPSSKGLVSHEIQEQYSFTNIVIVPEEKLPSVAPLGDQSVITV